MLRLFALLAFLASLVFASHPTTTGNSAASDVAGVEPRVLDPASRTGFILDLLETTESPEKLKVLLTEVQKDKQFLSLFLQPDKVEEASFAHPMFARYCKHSGKMLDLFLSNRFDLLKIYSEAGFLHFHMFDSVPITPRLMSGLIQFPGLVQEMFVFAGEANTEVVEALYQAGLPATLMAKVSREQVNLLEYMLMTGNLESAYVAYRYGARLFKPAYNQHYYEHQNGFAILPEDLADHIISHEDAPKAALFFASGSDHGCHLRGIPSDVLREHIGEALCRLIAEDSIDRLF